MRNKHKIFGLVFLRPVVLFIYLVNFAREQRAVAILLGLISPNFFAKRKDADTQRLEKNSPFYFTNILPQSAQLNSPNV
jgi:hypothetical protein